MDISGQQVSFKKTVGGGDPDPKNLTIQKRSIYKIGGMPLP
jgi:hypothetical protein